MASTYPKCGGRIKHLAEASQVLRYDKSQVMPPYRMSFRATCGNCSSLRPTLLQCRASEGLEALRAQELVPGQARLLCPSAAFQPSIAGI